MLARPTDERFLIKGTPGARRTRHIHGKILMADGSRPHEINYLVVVLTQAMIGLVSQSLLGAALEVNDEGVILHFAVSATSPEQTEDIDEIVGDFDAFLYPSTPPLEIKVFEGTPFYGWAGASAREVFRVKT